MPADLLRQSFQLPPAQSSLMHVTVNPSLKGCA